MELMILSCCSQGRPKGVTPKYSLKPLVPRLSELLGVEVGLFPKFSVVLLFKPNLAGINEITWMAFFFFCLG